MNSKTRTVINIYNGLTANSQPSLTSISLHYSSKNTNRYIRL